VPPARDRRTTRRDNISGHQRGSLVLSIPSTRAAIAAGSYDRRGSVSTTDRPALRVAAERDGNACRVISQIDFSHLHSSHRRTAEPQSLPAGASPAAPGVGVFAVIVGAVNIA